MSTPHDDACTGLAAIVDAQARVLVLGSFPGERSLQEREYYAHPRNAFWPIVGELIGVDPRAPYAQRIAALQSAGIALWDVAAACERRGSLDSAMRAVRPNAIASLAASTPSLRTILLNGATADTLFRRHVADALDRRIAHHRLPSTSPANAATGYASKRAAWHTALRAGLGERE